MEHVNTLRSSLFQALPDRLCTSVEHFAKAVTHALARRSVYRRTLGELQQLSDRELQDIGIPRSHIRRVALEESRKARING